MFKMFFNQNKGLASDPSDAHESALVFASTTSLERELDGSELAFQRYYYALYQCSPDEACDLNIRRAQIRDQYPDKVIAIGQRFVLQGEAAFQIVSAFYQSLALAATPDQYREYATRRHQVILNIHRASQSLPVPVDLTEGQLCADADLEFLTCLALSNRQVFPRGRS